MNPNEQTISKGWILEPEKKFLQSNLLLNNGFEHKFLTKLSNNLNLESYFERKDKQKYIYKNRQVHGNKVIKVSTINTSQNNEADSCISNDPNQSLWIYSADCIPLLFANPVNGMVAATHAGWRGLSLQVIQKTIEELEKYGCKRFDLLVAIGPSISGKNYEVDINTAKKLYQTITTKNNISTSQSKHVNDKIRLFNQEGFDYLKFKKKTNVDLRTIAYYQLMLEGVPDNNISINKNCTFSDSDLFNSWRREKSINRQYSYIIPKKV